MLDIRELYGMPVGMADKILQAQGYSLRTVDYMSKRGKAGADARIVRADMENGVVNAVVSWFNTDITQESE